MILKYCNFLLFIFIGLSFISCSKNSSITNSGSEHNNTLEFNITAEDTHHARPGGFIIFSTNVNRILKDSLTGVTVHWETNAKDVKLERQGPNTVAVFISKNFTDDKLTVSANIFNNGVSSPEKRKSKTIKLNDDPLQVENIHGFITSDIILGKEKDYRLTKDIYLKNNTKLTIKNGAILDLNGHKIISDHGTLFLEGTAEQKAILIVGGQSIKTKLKAQYAQILTSNNGSGIAVLKKSTIKNCEIYVPFAVGNSHIENSKISYLTSQISQNTISRKPKSVAIKNSTVYQLYFGHNYLSKVPNISSWNNTIFTVFLDTRDYDNTNIKFVDNNISYLIISGADTNGQTVFKNNFISRLVVNGSLGTLIHQNNLGLLKKRFYKKDEEPFLSLDWDVNFNKLNSPVVKVNTSGQFKVQKIDLTNNYWAPEILKEMNKKGPGKNISFIYDHYDNPSLDKVIYKNWSESEFK